MSDNVQAVVLAVIALLGGAFGKTLLDRWFQHAGRQFQAQKTEGQRQASLAFADNEQARAWLRAQLDEREEELRTVRESERLLFAEVGELRAQVGRQEERITAQAVRIDDLSATVKRLGGDYTEMKAERDRYRTEKHDVENRLTAESLARQLAERELVAQSKIVEQLRGEIAALIKKTEP